MSRIGKLPIAIPPKVEVTLDGQRIVVKGPKGTLERTLPDSIEVVCEDARLLVARRGESRRAREQHGLGRTLVANMVAGVTTGFTKPMQIAGVGYRIALTGRKLTINAGFSHPVEIELPAGIDIEVDPKASAIAGTRNQQGFNFVIKGFDKQAVGDLAAKIRDIRPPEPYKGKGIRYTAEKILLKAGKSGKK
ncbi:50S ribosomal protein L6 [Gloeobacter morelensis]|uniref:Large ribosomal subunit protein uL6 n=1 Tax=Gloeobacter morelensis MG652769 TaxID=2781736 RepID=A0ABY3PIZ6_9CYAN|nr:50S ribosomal protein L6 [Gloeobacter morelensis]UFP93522.1 50S ribosomal protein L6 [Gloeobacter morelensis MG652769]